MLVLVLGALTFGGAAPVAAAESGIQWIGTCSQFVDYQLRRTWGYCQGGGNSLFKVWVECRLPGFPWTYQVSDVWRVAGGNQSSFAGCGGILVDAGMDKQE
jgi:hypothetical protein